MAGKKLRKYLEKLGPDGFYDLYHAWSENAIVASNGLGYINLIVQLLKEHPDFQTGKPACTELDAYLDLSQQARYSIREFFWPMTDAQDYQRPWKERLKRWQPFDEKAWDSIPPQFSVVVQSVLPSLEEFPKIALACSDGLASPKNTITDLLNKLTEFFQRLHRLSIPAGIEYELLLHHHLFLLKADCNMFHFSLHVMRESCGENAVLLSELDSQSQQDQEFYLSLSRFFWPGTFGDDPEEEPVENHWYPYVESAWDAAQAQITDTCRSFVQITGQRLQTIQAIPAADLLDAEKFQIFLSSANTRLNEILRRVAILEL
jgi:hypothetical protein